MDVVDVSIATDGSDALIGFDAVRFGPNENEVIFRLEDIRAGRTNGLGNFLLKAAET